MYPYKTPMLPTSKWEIHGNIQKGDSPSETTGAI